MMSGSKIGSLEKLQTNLNSQNFYFEKLDIENLEGLKVLFKNFGPFDAVLNLAAQAEFVTAWKILTFISLLTQKVH